MIEITDLEPPESLPFSWQRTLLGISLGAVVGLCFWSQIGF